MSKTNTTPGGGSRQWVAISVLGFSGLALTAMAIVAILNEPTNATTIFNITLPVIASWVGTVLAYYFGRENFETANQQIRELVQLTTREKRAQALVVTFMRRFSEMKYLQIPEGKSDSDVMLSELRDKFTTKVTRMPVIDAEGKPKYMIHKSSIDSYVLALPPEDPSAEGPSLQKFIEDRKGEQVEYGMGKGFVVVSEETTLAEARQKMEQARPSKDIFVTRGGSDAEPLTGWITDTRLLMHLEVA
jgi:hypothetical protein